MTWEFLLTVAPFASFIAGSLIFAWVLCRERHPKPLDIYGIAIDHALAPGLFKTLADPRYTKYYNDHCFCKLASCKKKLVLSSEYQRRGIGWFFIYRCPEANWWARNMWVYLSWTSPHTARALG